MQTCSIKIENVPDAPSHRTSPGQGKLLSLSRAFLLLGFAMIVMSACKKDVEIPDNAVPFKAHFDAISVTVSQPTDPVQKDVAKGDGEGTPIGKAFLEATLTYDLTSPSPLKIIGESIITTAKGDKIYLTQDSYSPDPDEAGNFIVVGTLTITSGTGKYKHAKGTLTTIVKGNLTNSKRDVSIDGFISY